MKNNVNEKYNGKILGVRNDSEKPEYFIEDFLQEDIMVDFIVSTIDHESTFTKLGFKFVEEHYGLDEIIAIVLKQYPEFPFEDGITAREVLETKKKFAIEPSEKS